MIFRKQGKIIEICRSQFKTDESYYNEIYNLKKESDDNNKSKGTPISTCQFITNLLLKQHGSK